MGNVSRPMAEQFGADRLEVYTVPYTAQFHNPFSADNQMSYNDSRAEGKRTAVKAMTDMNDRCPLTSYVIAGFSQGAVIGGDLASDIGNYRGALSSLLDPNRTAPATQADLDEVNRQAQQQGLRPHAFDSCASLSPLFCSATGQTACRRSPTCWAMILHLPAPPGVRLASER